MIIEFFVGGKVNFYFVCVFEVGGVFIVGMLEGIFFFSDEVIEGWVNVMFCYFK